MKKVSFPVRDKSQSLSVKAVFLILFSVVFGLTLLLLAASYASRQAGFSKLVKRISQGDLSAHIELRGIKTQSLLSPLAQMQDALRPSATHRENSPAQEDCKHG